MKKMLLGLGLIALAGVVLFRDYLTLPVFDLPLWRIIVVAIFAYDALKNLFKGRYSSAFVGLAVSFIVLNSYYHWLQVELWSMILAAVLAYLGLRYLLPNKSSRFHMKWVHKGDYDKYLGQKTGDDDSTDSDTVFGGTTRYINGDFVDVDGDVVFGSVTIYFENAMILGDKATYSGDAVFSSVKLYIPRDWAVEVVGDRVFSSVDVPSGSAGATKRLVYTGDLVFSSLEVIYV